MVELHGFATPTNLITEFDEVSLKQPKYARQLAMVDDPESCMSDPVKPDPSPVETKEYSYDITVTVSTTSRFYEKYKWNEDRIHRLEALIARFAWMSSDSSKHAVAGIYSLDGNQIEMFHSLKKRFLGESLQHEDAFVREFQHIPEPKNLENWQCSWGL